MQRFLLIIGMMTLFLGAQTTIQAQNIGTYTQTGESDPEAKTILDKLKAKYDKLTALKADFSLLIEIPEEDRIEQKGTMAQMGDKYRLDLPEQSIITDGETLWYHVRSNNEVQINDAEELMDDEDFMSPQKVLEMYENGDFVYILADAYSKDGTVMQHIEFKPVDTDADIFKLKVLVNQKQNQIAEVKVFSRDGARYTLRITSFDESPNFSDTHFTFDPSQYPDIYVEDLRL